MKIPIADNLFLQYTQSAFIGGDAIGVGPRNFEWELADPKDARFVTDSYIKSVDGPGKVAWLLEPFFMHPENYFEAMNKNFDAVLTHNQYFAMNKGWRWCPHGGSWIAEKDCDTYNKSKLVSILISDKNSMPGHKLRHKIVEKYSERVEVLGLDKRVRAFEAYAPYEYSIIVENEKAPGYFTEKLIDCFSVGTVPIYWGCPNINHFFEVNGTIPFQYIEDLEYILSVIKEYGTAYKFDIRIENMMRAKKLRVCEDNLFRMYPELFREER